MLVISTPQIVPQNKKPFIKCFKQIKLFYLISLLIFIIIVMSIAMTMTYITINKNSTDKLENKYTNLLNKYNTKKPSFQFNNKDTIKQTQSTQGQFVGQQSANIRLKNEINTESEDYFRKTFFQTIGETKCDPTKPNATKHFYITRSVEVRVLLTSMIHKFNRYLLLFGWLVV